MGTVAKHLQQRNREIGVALAAARRAQHRNISECAVALGTTRRRYRAIEQGETGISAAELEVVANYLQITGDKLLPNLRLREDTEQVVVHARPGDVVRLVILEAKEI